MPHHGNEPFNETFLKKLRESVAPDALSHVLGDTGAYPDGKLAEDDEGEIRFAVVTKNGKVVLDFGKSVHWVGLTRHQALELGSMLINAGNNALLIEVK